MYWEIARILSVSCYFIGSWYILKYWINIRRRVSGLILLYNSYFRYIRIKLRSNVTLSLNKLTNPNKYSISSLFCFIYSNKILDSRIIQFFSPISWVYLSSNFFSLFCMAWLSCFSNFYAKEFMFFSHRLLRTANQTIISRKVR